MSDLPPERTLTVQIPSGLPEADARLIVAIGLFQEGHVSVGWAANCAGLSYRAFLEALHVRGIPAYVYDDEEDMRRELDSIRSLTRSLDAA